MVAAPHGFFAARRHLDLSSPDLSAPGLREYQNVPRTIGAVISLRMATLHELQTVYGVRDLYDMLEIAAVDGHNKRAIDRYIAKLRERPT